MEYLSNGTLHGYLPNVLDGLVCLYKTSFSSTYVLGCIQYIFVTIFSKDRTS